MGGMAAHGSSAPSPWVVRFAPLVAAGGRVLDLACGAGRHGRLFLDRRHSVTFLDRDLSGMVDLHGHAGAQFVQADIEQGPWPLVGQQFAGIVVTNYLWRPLFPQIAGALAPQGVLIYETFMQGNERFGKPSNPDFLLRPDELLDWCRSEGLTVRAFEQGEEASAVRQRISAVRND